MVQAVGKLPAFPPALVPAEQGKGKRPRSVHIRQFVDRCAEPVLLRRLEQRAAPHPSHVVDAWKPSEKVNVADRCFPGGCVMEDAAVIEVDGDIPTRSCVFEKAQDSIINGKSVTNGQHEESSVCLRIHPPHAVAVRPSEHRSIAAADLPRPSQINEVLMPQVTVNGNGGAQTLHSLLRGSTSARRRRACKLDKIPRTVLLHSETQVTGILVVKDAEHCSKLPQEPE